MLKSSGSLVLGLIALASLAAAPAYAGGDPIAKCQAAKIKAAGKKAACLTGARSKGVTKATTVDPAKIQKCVDKFNAAFAKAETKPPCGTTADTTALENKIDAFADDIVAAIAQATPSKCEAAKVKAAGKKASCLAAVQSKGIAKALAPDPAKIQKCLDKYNASWTKAELGSDCGPAVGDVGRIEDKVDAFIDDVLCELDVTGTCDCGGSADPAFLTFTTGLGTGNCGTGVNDAGAVVKTLACNDLYTGGGNAAVPPATIPDYGSTVTKATCCRNKFIASGATTSAETGSNRNCSTTNCLYGAPLPIISGASVCVINRVAQPAAGHLYCDTGSQDLNIPLNADVYLTIDTLGKRCDGSSPSPGLGCTADAQCSPGLCVNDPPIQPCPICNASTLVCNGGPNNGLACTPGTQLVSGPQWPTSHDCPPPGAPLGILPIPYSLTTGTATRTAVDRANQNRTFCGFCGDPGNAVFKNPAVACTSDNECAAFTTGCPGATPCTACRQGTEGAFGTLSVRTITENGSPAGAVTTGGPAASSTLATVFCIPPTFNGVIDAVGNLPGPGAASLQGSAQILP